MYEMYEIAPKFRDVATNAAQNYWNHNFGPIPWSACSDLAHAVAWASADPAVGYWRDAETEVWDDAVDRDGEYTNHCGELDYAERITACMDYVRTHFRP